MRIRRRWGIAVVAAGVALLAAAPAAQEPPETAFSALNQARVLYVGDSIAAESQAVVAQSIQGTGKAVVTADAKGGMALCDYLTASAPSDVPPADKLAARVQAERPDLVILQFWGNSWEKTPCTGGAARGTEAFYARYLADAVQAQREIAVGAAAAGIDTPRVLWVRQGPDRAAPSVPERLNALYDRVARRFAGRTSDAGHDVSMAAHPAGGGPAGRYAWTQFLPCTPFERQAGFCTDPQLDGGAARLHTDADPLHFCLDPVLTGTACAATSPGVIRYAMRIAHDANAWLGL